MATDEPISPTELSPNKPPAPNHLTPAIPVHPALPTSTNTTPTTSGDPVPMTPGDLTPMMPDNSTLMTPDNSMPTTPDYPTPIMPAMPDDSTPAMSDKDPVPNISLIPPTPPAATPDRTLATPHSTPPADSPPSTPGTYPRPFEHDQLYLDFITPAIIKHLNSVNGGLRWVEMVSSYLRLESQYPSRVCYCVFITFFCLTNIDLACGKVVIEMPSRGGRSLGASAQLHPPH